MEVGPAREEYDSIDVTKTWYGDSDRRLQEVLKNLDRELTPNEEIEMTLPA